MTIRFAQSPDIPGILNLLTQVEKVHNTIRPDLFRDAGEKYDAQALTRLFADPSRPILVALEGNLVVGYAFCILQILDGDPILRDRKELYLDDLCVDADFRGHGVSKALWQQVRELAKALGCSAVTLNVWEGNDRARAFYDHCGLKVRKTVMEYPL